MKPTVRISDAEWEVMNLAWARAPIASSAIVDELSARKGWRSRTIRTLLDRLVKKGALTYASDGKRFLYRPGVTLEACVRRESRSFLDRVFGGEPAAMLINLVKETDLSADDIKELKRILQEKEK